MFVGFFVWLISSLPGVDEGVVVDIFLDPVGYDLLKEFPYAVQEADGSVAGWAEFWFIGFWDHRSYGVLPFGWEVSYPKAEVEGGGEFGQDVRW